MALRRDRAINDEHVDLQIAKRLIQRLVRIPRTGRLRVRRRLERHSENRRKGQEILWQISLRIATTPLGRMLYLVHGVWRTESGASTASASASRR